MANSPLCTCCTPRTVLLPAHEDTAEPRWRCVATGAAYAVRDGALVTLTAEPVAVGMWDATESPWGESAGATTVRTVPIDLSRYGYA